MSRLSGKTALITGGAHGIGHAIASAFGCAGARVAVTDLDCQAAEQVAASINALGGRATAVRMDVTSETSVRHAVAQIIALWDHIDILVNNAGVLGPNKPDEEILTSEWQHVMNVNVMGAVHCTRAVVTQMMQHGGGSIINICAAYATVGAPNTPPYHASKGALRSMTKTDAMLYARRGIRVNAINPSFVATGMLDELLSSLDYADPLAELAALHPLGRIGRPEDVAWGALYLASDESSFVTGSELVIDGGYTAR